MYKSLFLNVYILITTGFCPFYGYFKWFSPFLWLFSWSCPIQFHFEAFSFFFSSINLANITSKCSWTSDFSNLNGSLSIEVIFFAAAPWSNYEKDKFGSNWASRGWVSSTVLSGPGQNWARVQIDGRENCSGIHIVSICESHAQSIYSFRSAKVKSNMLWVFSSSILNLILNDLSGGVFESLNTCVSAKIKIIKYLAILLVLFCQQLEQCFS